MFQGRHKRKEIINLTINGAKIKVRNSVTLLGDKIDNELSFSNHIIKYQIISGNKINAISRIQNFLVKWKRKLKQMHSFTEILTIANYFGIFQQRKAQIKLTKFNNVA